MQDWQVVKKVLKDLLAPPGEGVFAVTSKSSIKESLQEKIYKVPSSKAKDMWLEQLSIPPDNLSILGIASDCGGGILRGANWGPLYLRNKLYDLHDSLYDLGDIKVIPQLLIDDYLNQATIEKCRDALYQNINNNYPVSPLSITEMVLSKMYTYKHSLKVLGLGGDHSVSYPLVKNYLKFKSKRNQNIGIIHFDAHTDLLESRQGLPITFGSWVYHVLPFLQDKSHFVQIGIRASNQTQSYWEEKYGIKQYWANEILEGKISNKDIVNYLRKKQISEIYISFDIDAIDQKFAGATGTSEPNGLLSDSTFQMLNDLIENFKLTGADLVEVAPFIRVERNDQTLEVSQKIMSILCRGMLCNSI